MISYCLAIRDLRVEIATCTDAQKKVELQKACQLMTKQMQEGAIAKSKKWRELGYRPEFNFTLFKEGCFLWLHSSYAKDAILLAGHGGLNAIECVDTMEEDYSHVIESYKEAEDHSEI